MRASRGFIVAGGCAAIVTSGIITAPEAGTVDIVDPGGEAPADNVFAGPPVSNLKGTYQVQIVVDAGAVTSVEVLQAGTQAAESVAVNSMALPELTAAMVAAQDWDVDHVSGASYTSPAIIESAQGAFEDAGLA